MSDLRLALQDAGFDDVATYINSGNILLASELSLHVVNTTVEGVVQRTFGLNVPAVTLAKPDFLRIASELPSDWMNNSDMRCDCLLLWQGVDAPDVLKNFTIKPDIDQVKYVAGAILWSVDRRHVTKSGLAKIIGTATYKQMTIRNANTVRKLAVLLQ